MTLRYLPAIGILAAGLLARTAAGEDFEGRTFQAADKQLLAYRIMKPLDYDPKQKYPIVLFLHGAGERGHDNVSQLNNFVKMFAEPNVRGQYRCFVLAPQCFWNRKWVEVPWGAAAHRQPEKPSGPLDMTFQLMAALEKEFSIDPARRYVIGLSMGGYGAWDAICREPARFAAAVPICGGGDESKAAAIAKVPVWAFHGGVDGTVKTARSRNMIAAMQKAGGTPKYTEYAGVGHDAWTPASKEPQLLPWLFAQKADPKAAGAPASQPKAAGRGRPVLDAARRSFVSDRGTLLRGPRYSTDITFKSPDRQAIAGLRSLGCNTLHLYGEAFSAGKPAGHNVKVIDELVEWTRQDGLYLVLTIGNLTKNGQFDYDYAMAFWDLYAARYANETHVLFEVQNEPAKYPGYSAAALKMERDAYAKIRSKAPDTPVLLFSYALFVNPLAVLQDIRSLGPSIDWRKTAVAFHGYALGDAIFCLDGVLKAGYPCFQTEFTDLSMIRDFETRGISWVSFVDLPQVHDPKEFKDHLDRAGIKWTPDFGLWPRPAAPPN